MQIVDIYLLIYLHTYISIIYLCLPQVDVPSLLPLLGVRTRGGPHSDALRSGDLLYLDIYIYNIYIMWISISIIFTTCRYQYLQYLLQILASLRTVRSNYVHLTNLPTRFIHCRISFSQINISFVIEGTEMKERLPENQKSIKNPTPPSTRPAFQVQSEQGRVNIKVVRECKGSF